MMVLAATLRHADPARVQNVVNLILIIAVVVLVIIAVAKLLGAAVMPRATWWAVLFAAIILFVVWLLW